MTIGPLHLDPQSRADACVDFFCQVLSDDDNLRAWVQQTRLGDAIAEVDVDFLQGQGVLWFRTVSQMWLCRAWGLSGEWS